MGTKLGAVAVAVGLLVAGSVIGAWQQRPVPPDENRPGYPTPARVWIQNRGPAETIPVHWEGRNAEPVWVDLRGRPVDARAARQVWEYRQVVVEPGDDMAAALNRLGGDGWEAVLAAPADDRLRILLKRPQ